MKKLNELLGKLKSKITDISTLAENAYNGVGLTLSLTDQPVNQIWEKGIGLFAKSRPKRAPAGATSGTSILINRNVYGQDYETLTFLHELLHTSPRGKSHRSIARAIADMEGVRPEFDRYLSSRNDPDTEASAFINSWINEHCTKKEGVAMSWNQILTIMGSAR